MIEIHQDAADAVRADSLCKAIGRTLKRHYPNRAWYVDVSIRGGVAKILCPSISMRHGFVLHIDKPLSQMEQDVVSAGGQILEMFKLSRDRDASGGEELIVRNPVGEAIKAASGL